MKTDPDGKILWPHEYKELGRALFSLFPDDRELKKGVQMPQIFCMEDGTLCVYRADIGAFVNLVLPRDEVISSWFVRGQVFNLITPRSRSKTFILQEVRPQKVDWSPIREAYRLYSRDPDYWELDISGTSRRVFVRTLLDATGQLVARRQLSPTRYVEYTRVEFHSRHLVFDGPSGQLFCSYRPYMWKAKYGGFQPSAAFLEIFQDLRKRTDAGR